MFLLCPESYPEVTSELQQRKKVDEEGSKTHKTSNGEGNTAKLFEWQYHVAFLEWRTDCLS